MRGAERGALKGVGGLVRALLRGRRSTLRDAAGSDLGAGAAERARLQEERSEMIRGVQELGETTVKEVMVPRTDTFFVPITATREEMFASVVEAGHSRIPVYRGSIDDVVGVLYAKDLLRFLVVGEEYSLPALLRKPFFVPETKRIDSLLREFRKRHVHIAIAVDEYGGVSGIVCLEDIIEEIVGNIQDEFDEEREDIVELEDGSLLCDARVNLEDLNAASALALPAEAFDSLGGYVFDLFGRIPLRGESIEGHGAEYTVQEIEGHRIELVRVAPFAKGVEST